MRADLVTTVTGAERRRLIESLRPWLGSLLLALGEEDPVLSSREVALLFRVCPATVRRWADTGRLEAMRTPGGRWVFSLASVRRALESFEPNGHAASEPLA
ncbi:MAG: helix-turn-helix domain-containing protein [Actinomycetota bacterium]|nr:helix-turn-helix domain-containing protein [Actinomycetota bacterium]